MNFGTVIQKKGVVLPPGVLLREEIGPSGLPNLTVVSTGGLRERNDKIFGKVYAYGDCPLNQEKFKKTKQPSSKK